MTCGEFKQWLANQPDDKQIQFAYVATNGEITHLDISEAWPANFAYCVEFEAVVLDQNVDDLQRQYLMSHLCRLAAALGKVVANA